MQRLAHWSLPCSLEHGRLNRGQPRHHEFHIRSENDNQNYRPHPPITEPPVSNVLRAL